MPQPVDPADLPMPATPAADTLSWDWRGQPDLGRLATILARHGVRLRQVDTGSDQYEVEVSSTPAVGEDGCDDPDPADEPDPAERDQALHDALQEDAEMDTLLRDDDDAGPAPEPDSGWEPGRRDVVGLFKPADYTGPIFEVELGPEDLAALQRRDPAWLDDLCQRIATTQARWRAAPEPDSGPGWNRVWLLNCMVTSLPSATYNEPDLHDEARRQVLALLTDRDRLAAGLDTVQGWLDLRDDTARAELATARRDAAAELAMQQHHTCADVVRGLAGEIRAGTRPVPGSPQPDSEGGGDDAE